jgi:tRNA(fMet)-specific endonuclease VapC
MICLDTNIVIGIVNGRSSSLRHQLGVQMRAGIAVALPVETEDAVHAGNIRAELETAGTPIGHYDYLIAAQARRRGAALVTLNRREFARVPGLLVTDWVA